MSTTKTTTSTKANQEKQEKSVSQTSEPKQRTAITKSDVKMKIFRYSLGKDENGKDIKVPMPVYSTDGAACFDMYSANTEPIVVQPGQTVKLDMGMKIEVAEGFQLKLNNRSGLSTKNGINLAHCVGIVDCDYRGQLVLPIRNNSKNSFVIEPFMRICQGEICEAPRYGFEEVSSENKLSKTTRGEGGLGSTGIK
jgi:dUTP pyrophosphatase